jgi:hypothetical protein
MTTIIDSLVVTLGIDSTSFTKGQQEAMASFKKTGEQAVNSGKDIEGQFKKSGEAIGTVKTQFLELFAAAGGGAALVDLAAKITAADTAVGRLSRSTNVSAETISKWQGAAGIYGSTAEGMAGSFIAISDAVAGFKVGSVSPLIADFRTLSAAGGTMIDINKGVDQTLLDRADNFKAIHDRDPAQAGFMGRRMGLDAGLLDLLMKGSGEVQKMLDKVNALGPATKASVDQAGNLAKAWNTVQLALEGKGRSGVNSVGPAVALMLDTVSKDLSTPRGEFGSGFKNTTWDDWWGAIIEPFVGKKATATSSASPTSQSYRSAIASIESRGSGGYSAVGPVTRSGDRAYGKYQIMGNNIGEWSKAALGKEISVQDFMASPTAQDAIFDHKFGQYVKQFGNPQDAASAWLTGKPLSAGAYLRDQNGTSGAGYAARFTAGLGGGSTTTSSVVINGPITIQAGPNADGATIANKFTDTLKRQSYAAQANYGQN